jgi:phage-related protein
MGQPVEFPRARPMPSIAPGCHELRIKDETVDWRIVVCITPDAIAILEVFPKKAQRTPHAVLANCKRRLSAYLRAIR